MTFVVVLFGGIFSMRLQGFAHALVAYWGGDTWVKDKGYLSLDPTKIRRSRPRKRDAS